MSDNKHSIQPFEKVIRARKQLLILLGVIVGFGLVMVLSSSYQFSKALKDSSYYFFNRQVIFTVTAIGLCFVTSKVKGDFWYKYSHLLHYLIYFITILTLVPGIGHPKNGASRWISLFGLSFQPAEFLKYTFIP